MLSIRKLYSDFPWVFDALYPVIYNYAQDFACYDALLKSIGTRYILDLGCGTGLLARYMVKAGYDYTGVDISAGMLAIARRNVPSGRFIRCDMRDLTPLRDIKGEKFDAILCTGRAFSHLTTDGEIRACLGAVGKLLRVGGIFACDTIDANKTYPHRVQRITESTPIGYREFQRKFIHKRLLFKTTTIITKIRWHILEGAEIISTFKEKVRTRVFSSLEFARFFTEAGLSSNFMSSNLPHQPVILLASACKFEA